MKKQTTIGVLQKAATGACIATRRSVMLQEGCRKGLGGRNGEFNGW